jgi:hypothetical protein
MFDPGRRTLRSYKMNKNKENDEVKLSSSSSSSTAQSDSSDHHFFSRIKSSFSSALLRPYRVDEKAIAKHKQYQILVLGQVDAKQNDHGLDLAWNSQLGYVLEDDQRDKMKMVTSLVL